MDTQERFDNSPPRHTGASLVSLLDFLLKNDPDPKTFEIALDGTEGTFTPDIRTVTRPDRAGINDQVLVNGTFRGTDEVASPARLTLPASDETTPLSIEHLSPLPTEEAA